MGTPLNRKIIRHSILLLTLLLPNVSNGNSCDTKAENNTCVQILVKSNIGRELANMVVYLEPLDGQVLEKSLKEVIVGQFGKSFSPYLSVSQVNSKVSFVNKDDITHHIYSAGNENRFSFTIRPGETNSSAKFEHASDVAMGCNIHDWMSGHLLVVNTPYFDKTDELGRVSFNIAKHGKYKVVVWHPQMQADNNRMTIEKNIYAHDTLTFILKEEMESIPLQASDDDFDFLSDY
ncbi:MAG: hypothetical protein ACI971_002339 [Colwellia sp.]|jgi:hypothetical protein